MSKLDREYECPYLAGYSKDGQTIYIDRRMPRILKLKDGRTMNVDKYLKVHEDTEKHLEDTMDYMYQYAHEQATGAERRAVEADGYPWDEYEAWMMKEVKRLTDLDGTTPPDIDLKPEHDYHDSKMAAKVEGLQKGLAKPNQQPDMPAGKQVSQIEDHKQDLDWKTRNVTLHKGNPVNQATGKLAAMIRRSRSMKLKKDLEPLNRPNNQQRGPAEISATHTSRTVPGEDDSSPLTKALTPEGNRDEAHETSRERKGNKDLNAKQPTGLKGKGARPPQGKPGAPDKPLRKSDMPIAVSTVAVISGDHILMGRRRDTKKLVMPGGHADPGEHPEQAARRELYEEAGINAKDLKFLGSEDVVTRDGKVRRINCFVTFGYFQPTNVHDPDQEIEEWLWVPAVKYAPAGIADALEDEIAEQLHDRKNNIMLKLLGIAH